MGHLNSPNNLSDDDLLKLIENAPKIEQVSKSEIDSVKELVFRFLSNFNINPGSNPVSLNVICKLIKHWSGIKITSSNLKKNLKGSFKLKDSFVYINVNQSYINKKTFEFLDKKRVQSKTGILKKIEEFLESNNIKPGPTKISISHLWSMFNNNFFKYEDFKAIIQLKFQTNTEYVKISKN